ncbi:LOW QUALITY PROTEIN: Integrase, catalytic core protein [Phytophthora megakarya]|uniref:Integrase, catalytic core protein n=1 Tax=Phytophthora megakarya TaxID=4795 RepID=A0A225VEZ9_9STRA|nr:LOW QUALITY PROTEIN: Integrase, catalytic core protein [Phytophthora megakarya]
MTLPFTNVLISPNAPVNQLSEDMLENNGWTVKYGFINTQRRKKRDTTSWERWHLRLGHLNSPAIQRMVRDEVATGMEATSGQTVDTNSPCWSCKAAKMIRMSYKKTDYVNEITYDGYKHFQFVQNEASRYLWGFLLYRKKNASDVVLEHLKWLTAQGNNIEVFNSDQGKELFNNKLKIFLRSKGIEYTTTNLYSPEENDLVERMNGVVLSRVRCLLTAANMSWLLWGEAFHFALEGRDTVLPTVWKTTKPDLTVDVGLYFFIFTPKVLRSTKLENSGKPGLFVGYAKHSESYRVLHLITGNIVEVRSVECEEDWTVESSYVPTGSAAAGALSTSEDVLNLEVKKTTKQMGGEMKPRERPHSFVSLTYSTSKFEIPSSLVVQVVNLLTEPQSVQEALQAPWKEALEKEHSALMRNNTWKLVNRLKGKKGLTRKWIFVRKRNPKGDVIRHRARITIKACQQRYGVDFWETYAPLISNEAVKLVLLLALHYDLECEHIGFVTAFLNGPIGEDVESYMEILEFFDDGSGRLLDEPFRSCGFKRSNLDNGVSWRVVGGNLIFLTVYVDDVIIAAKAENVKLVLSELEAKFKTKDLGSVSLLLGMEINYIVAQTMWISQRSQMEKILSRFGMRIIQWRVMRYLHGTIEYGLVCEK